MRLYERQASTLVASWRAYARHSRGACVREEEGAVICVFPAPPERGVYNNALLSRGLDPGRAARAVEAVGAAYREAEIANYAVWAHEAEPTTLAALEEQGYRFDSATRAMVMKLDSLTVPRPRLELGRLDWRRYAQEFLNLPGLLADADAATIHLRAVRLEGREVAAVIAYDHEGDCGIFNLGTHPAARRRGIGTALTALQLHEARDRGCTTASLQSTPMAEGVYASLGFESLGRYMEYVRPEALGCG